MPVKISGLPAGAALGGTEQLPAVQSSVTVRTTISAIYTYVLAAITAGPAAARTALGLGTAALINTPITVPNGGTGVVTLTTAYGVLCAGTTATGTVQNTGAGSSAQVLTSNGAAALPTFQPVPLPTVSQITNSLSGDVALNNVANFFDGPSVAQGTVGTWYASGTVTVEDTTGAAAFYIKLWDGTTVIAAGQVNVANANAPAMASLSGYLPTPAGNLRISVRDLSSTSGQIRFNKTGTSKDSTISAYRIA